MIPDPYLRRRVAVGRLDPSEKGLANFLQSYRSFDLVLGMRFHANVCPIGMGVPSRGLLNYPQIGHLYDELELQDRLIDVREPGFSKYLVEAVLTDLSNLSTQRLICAERVTNLNRQAQATLKLIDEWLFLNID
jgi:polysaccharide pyruvyl transferase WcaK-like protein